MLQIAVQCPAQTVVRALAFERPRSTVGGRIDVCRNVVGRGFLVEKRCVHCYEDDHDIHVVVVVVGYRLRSFPALLQHYQSSIFLFFFLSFFDFLVFGV